MWRYISYDISGPLFLQPFLVEKGRNFRSPHITSISIAVVLVSHTLWYVSHILITVWTQLRLSTAFTLLSRLSHRTLAVCRLVLLVALLGKELQLVHLLLISCSSHLLRGGELHRVVLFGGTRARVSLAAAALRQHTILLAIRNLIVRCRSVLFISLGSVYVVVPSPYCASFGLVLSCFWVFGWILGS